MAAADLAGAQQMAINCMHRTKTTITPMLVESATQAPLLRAVITMPKINQARSKRETNIAEKAATINIASILRQTNMIVEAPMRVEVQRWTIPYVNSHPWKDMLLLSELWQASSASLVAMTILAMLTANPARQPKRTTATATFSAMMGRRRNLNNE